MAVECFGEGAYVVVRSDGLGELADTVDEYMQKGFRPAAALHVVPGANLRPTEYLQVVIRDPGESEGAAG